MAILLENQIELVKIVENNRFNDKFFFLSLYVAQRLPRWHTILLRISLRLLRRVPFLPRWCWRNMWILRRWVPDHARRTMRRYPKLPTLLLGVLAHLTVFTKKKTNRSMNYPEKCFNFSIVFIFVNWVLWILSMRLAHTFLKSDLVPPRQEFYALDVGFKNFLR